MPRLYVTCKRNTVVFVLYAVTIGLSATLLIFGTANGCVNDAPADYYDFIVLDAYSSDAIPVHLLTREAMAVYLAKLTEHGIGAFISRTFFSTSLPWSGTLPMMPALRRSYSQTSRFRRRNRNKESIRRYG